MDFTADFPFLAAAALLLLFFAPFTTGAGVPERERLRDTCLGGGDLRDWVCVGPWGCMIKMEAAWIDGEGVAYVKDGGHGNDVCK